MDTTDLQREEELYEAARQISDAGARGPFLAQACADDSALRERMERLLATEEAADRFFDDTLSAVKLPEPPLGMLSGSSSKSGGTKSPLGEELPGSRIGRYKLLEKIGEGGCGVVYRAAQEWPVQRQVALKIIKLGMETKSVIARFEAERQALALMDHPHIARVFDAGATDRGSPYFVMELVGGTKITDYCDQHQLGLEQRLELFIQICHAIQHAHQKGVIHGDIKPSNLLVARHDDMPQPKVIDFGIAKATEARLTDQTLFTLYAQLVGTPTYMSPEQAEMGGVDIDTRSDIYSLGVLLYELLTGKTPFDSHALLDSGLDEFRRILRQKEPPSPSMRFGALVLKERNQTALVRQTDPDKLVSQLHGDLDWIVMRALEKDRQRRYETANGLAMDVQRYLNNEPVTARPPSWAYRLHKLVRRNRGVFVAVGAVSMALVSGFGASTWMYLKEREAHQRAVAAEREQARLRREAEVRRRVTQAALLVSQEHYRKADQLWSGITLDRPTVEGAAVLRSLGEWHALEHRWREASDRFQRLLKVNHLDGPDVASLDYLRAGPVLVEAGDMDGYNRFRLDLITHFDSQYSAYVDRVVKVSLLTPADAEVLRRLAPLAAMSEKASATDEAVRNEFRFAWEAMSLALWEYRRGNYAKAIAWCQRCLASPDHNEPRAATAHVIHAMASQRLGKTADAQSELAQARMILGSKYKEHDERGTPVQGFWFDTALAKILLREAEGVTLS